MAETETKTTITTTTGSSDKNTPKARAVRTLLTALAGYAASWSALVTTTDWSTGGKIIVLNTIAAVTAGGIAYLQALSEMKASTLLEKIVATFSQSVVAGGSAFVLADVTGAAAIATGRAVASVIAGAVFATLATLGLNASEGGQPTT